MFLWFLHMLFISSIWFLFCQISHHCRGNSRRRRRSCCPSPHPPVQWNFQNIWNIQIIHLTKLPNEIFRIFKILKMWEKYFRKQNCLACLWSMHWVLLTHCLCCADSLEWSLIFVKKLAIVFFALELKKIQLYNIQIQVQSTACAEWSLIFERKYTVGCHTRVEALQSWILSTTKKKWQLCSIHWITCRQERSWIPVNRDTALPENL